MWLMYVSGSKGRRRVMVMDLCLQRAPFGKQSKSRVDAAVMNLYDGWAAVAATFFLLVNTPFFFLCLFFTIWASKFALRDLGALGVRHHCSLMSSLVK